MLCGREDDLTDLGELLGDEPLIVVRGPWGCGKSELLRGFAHRLYRDDPDLPVYLIDIEGVRERDALVARIAERMMLAHHDERSVVLALREQSSPVLLLDECDGLEQEAANWLRSLCDRCPGATIYCATQRDLGVEALSFDLPNLPVVSSDPVIPSAATQLVLELTRKQGHRGNPSEVQLQWAQRLAGILRGNPRAIRFAVGLLSVLSPDALIEELQASHSALLEGRHADALISRFEELLWARISGAGRELLALIAVRPDGVGLNALAGFFDAVPTAQLAELETLSLLEREGDLIRAAPLVAQLIQRVSPERSQRAFTRWGESFANEAVRHLPQLENPSVKEGRKWFIENEQMLRILVGVFRSQAVLSDKQVDLILGTTRALRIAGRSDATLIRDARLLTADPRREALLLFEEARCDLEVGDYDRFVALCELAESRLKEGADDEAKHALSSVALAGRWWQCENTPPEGGDAYETPEIHRFRAAAAYRRGDLESTEREYKAWVDATPVTTHGMQYTLAMCCLGFIYTQRNKLDLAESTISQAMRVAKGLATPRYEGLANLYLAEVRYRQGGLAAAHSLAEKALERFVSLGLVLLAADARTMCGDLLFVKGDRKAAQDHYAASVRIYELGNRNLRRSRNFLRLAALAASMDNRDLADEHRKQALAQMDLSVHDDALTAAAWSAFIERDGDRLEGQVNDNAQPGEPVPYEWLVARDAYRSCQQSPTTEEADRPLLTVSETTAWFDPPYGDRYRFRRDTPMRRMAAALFRARAEQPGMPIGSDELFAIGWPGQRAVGTSGANRLWVTLSRLRGLGLGEALVKEPDGYLIDPSVELRFE